MATSKVNHNSGFITISIVILLAGVAIFSGQFIPDYFGGNVIGGPGGGGGGGGSFGGGGGTTLPIIADTLNPIYLSVSSIGQTSVSLAFQLPCNIGDNTQQNQQCEENAISNYQIRYGTQGEITDDNVFNTLPGPVYCLVGSNCLALDENTVIERTISGLQPNTQYWFVAQYTHKTKGDSPWSNSPPGKTLTNDADGDGIINTNDVCPNTPAGQQVDSTGCADSQIDIDSDTYTRDVDCNDNNANVNPQALEICGDGIDNDCSGADAVCAPGDIDNDGYTIVVDCNDNNAAINPGAAEVCNDLVDNNCNGDIDTEDSACEVVAPQDDDNDGVPDVDDVCPNTPSGQSVNSNGCADSQIDADSDGYTKDLDCNDNDSNINPGKTEICGDAIDQDCTGADLACAPTDNDDDGVSNANDICPNTPAGETANSNGCSDSQIDGDSDTYTLDLDCNDNDATINPGVTEVCGDGIDNDCSGADLICNGDDDGDGIINANDLCSGTSAGASVNSNGCSDAQIDNDSDTYTEVAGDCNDGDAAIKPGATDVCGDGIDQDCAGGDLVCGTSGGSGGSGSGGGGGGGAGGSGTTSGGSQQTGTSKPADEPKLDTSKKYFDVTAPAKDKTDYFGLSIVTILGVVLVVFGYLRYFKPELAKKLFGSKTYENKSGTENSNSISNISKNITNSFNKLFKKE